MQYDTIILLGLINHVAIVVCANLEFQTAARAGVVQGSCQDLVRGGSDGARGRCASCPVPRRRQVPREFWRRARRASLLQP